VAARLITREQALNWRPGWSHADITQIEADLDRLQVANCVIPTSGQYIGCRNGSGQRVMYIAPGYVWFRRGFEPPDRELPPWNGYGLSTFRDPGSPTPSETRQEQFCPIHNLALPATGVCDECE